MIDLPTQKDLSSPHHRKAIGVLIAAVVVFGLALTVIYLKPTEQAAQPGVSTDTAIRAELVDQLTSAATRIPPVNKADLIKRVKTTTNVSASAERASIIDQLQTQ